MEIRFSDDAIPFVSTQAFHNDREAAAHLEQHEHMGRLHKAAEYAKDAMSPYTATLVDLGCGDGGLLSLVKSNYLCWGYDFQPANVVAAKENRGADVRYLDILNDFDQIDWADVAVMTETLEHFADPHAYLRRVHKETDVSYFIASSPNGEDWSCHDSLHVWGWDMEGYRQLFEQAGWRTIKQEPIDRFQTILAGR